MVFAWGSFKMVSNMQMNSIFLFCFISGLAKSEEMLQFAQQQAMTFPEPPAYYDLQENEVLNQDDETFVLRDP